MTRDHATSAAAFAAVTDLLGDYFDGLYLCDVARLERVFHPQARYWTAVEGELTDMGMAEYLPIVARRESPASRNEARADRIVSIEFAGPVTGLARVQCRIGPRYFTDLLSIIKLDGRWQIISKVFHFDIHPSQEADSCHT